MLLLPDKITFFLFQPQKMSKSNAYIKAKRSDSSALRLDPMSLDPNDDERLKQRLDKVCGFFLSHTFS